MLGVGTASPNSPGVDRLYDLFIAGRADVALGARIVAWRQHGIVTLQLQELTECTHLRLELGHKGLVADLVNTRPEEFGLLVPEIKRATIAIRKGREILAQDYELERSKVLH